MPREDLLTGLSDAFVAGLKAQRPPPVDATSRGEVREQAKALTEKVKGDAAKFAVLCGDGDVQEGELSGAAGTLLQSSSALVYCSRRLSAGQAGPSLRKALDAGEAKLAEAHKEMLTSVLGTATGDQRSQALKQAIGKLWEAAADLQKLALDNNNSCLFKQMGEALLAAKAAKKEVEDMLSEAAAAGAIENGGHKDDGEDKEEEDEDDFTDMGTLSPAEVEVAVWADKLLGCAMSTLKAVGQPLLGGPPLVAGAGLEEAESLAWNAAQLQKSVYALGAALYAPQDAEEVAGEGEAVYNTLSLLLQEFPEALHGHGEGGAASRAAFAEAGAQLEGAFRGLEEAVEGLRRV